MAAEEPQVAWDASPKPDWHDVVNAWPWNSLGAGDWAKSGTCPRCDHGITVLKEGSVITRLDMTEEDRQGLLVLAEEAPMIVRGQEGPQFFARCDCGEKHPGRPPDLTRGCGSWAFIDPPPERPRNE